VKDRVPVFRFHKRYCENPDAGRVHCQNWVSYRFVFCAFYNKGRPTVFQCLHARMTHLIMQCPLTHVLVLFAEY